MAATTEWKDLKEDPPPTSEFCYFTDGKSVAIGIWIRYHLILKGRVDNPKKWAPLNGPEPKIS